MAIATLYILNTVTGRIGMENSPKCRTLLWKVNLLLRSLVAAFCKTSYNACKLEKFFLSILNYCGTFCRMLLLKFRLINESYEMQLLHFFCIFNLSNLYSFNHTLTKITFNKECQQGRQLA